MGLRSRVRSGVLELALVAVEGLVSRLELVEDKLMDLSDPLVACPDLEDEELEDLEDLKDFVDAMSEGLDFKDHEEAGSESMDYRLHPISLVDAETDLPVIVLEGKKDIFGAVRRLVLPDVAFGNWADCEVVGIQVTIHTLPDLAEKEQSLDCSAVSAVKGHGLSEESKAILLRESGQANDRFSVPLYGRDLRIDDGINLFLASDWNSLSEFTGDRYAKKGPGSMGHPGLRDYPGINDLSELGLEIALGPLGQDREEPHRVSVSLMVRINNPNLLSPGVFRERAFRSVAYAG